MGNDKKTSPARGRIMQVVEVEEDDAGKQKVDIPVPSEIVKNEETPTAKGATEKKVGSVSRQESEKPDIADAFPMEDRGKDELTAPPQTPDKKEEEIQPLKPGERKDIVSELFETKDKQVSYPNVSLDRKPSRFGFILWVIVLLVVVGLIGGGLLYFKNASSSEETSSAVETPTPSPEPTPTETPMATVSGTPKATPTKVASPSATPKKTGLTIQVLNGSGEKGVASAAKKLLEEKGYTVVSTGNADNFDYAQTEIIIKSDKVSSLDKLKSDLSGSYTVGSTSATLDPNAAYDAQVIVGKE